MKKTKLINSRLIISIIVILVGLVNFYFNLYSMQNNRISAMLSMLVSLCLVIANRKNLFLFLLSLIIMYFNYSIVVTVYGKLPDIFLFYNIQNQNIRGMGINIILIFSSFLFLFTSSQKSNNFQINQDNIFLSNKKNDILVSFAVVMISVIFMLSFFSERYLIGINLATLYEYSIIFFILGFYYSSDNKGYLTTLLALLAAYSGKTFFEGNRASVLPMIIVALLMLFNNKIGYKKILPLIIFGIIILTGVGIYDDTQNFSFQSAIHYLQQSYFANDTAYASYYTSMSFIIYKSLISFKEICLLLGYYLLSIFFGGGVPNSNLPLLTKDVLFHYNGGILPIYFYFYLGIFGVILCAFIVGTYFNMIGKLELSSSAYKKLLSVYIVSTVPRWYLYSPSPLLRGVLIFTLVYYLFILLNYFLKKTLL